MKDNVICNCLTNRCPSNCEHSRLHLPLDVTLEKQCHEVCFLVNGEIQCHCYLIDNNR